MKINYAPVDDESRQKKYLKHFIAGIVALSIAVPAVVYVTGCTPQPSEPQDASPTEDTSTQEALDALESLTSTLVTEQNMPVIIQPEVPPQEESAQEEDTYVVSPDYSDPYFDPDTGLCYPPEVATVYAADGTYLGVEDPWRPEGYFSSGDYELDCMIKDYCDRWSSPDLDFSDNAYNTYLHVSWTEPVERDNNQYFDGPNWSIQYAKQLYWYSSGNCYEFSAFVEYVLKYFGYQDVHAEPCNILRQSGNWGVHGLTFVTNHTGEACFCDAALSSKGWMLPVYTYTYEIFNNGQY
ncbi:MAG: hypothetical protein IKE43_04350 [Coriobacteriales bacterium]|nr:hypothetical protein [Coriobacteriales bacterium]